MTVTPLFILSMPRSGSTLVQRVLSVDPLIATTAETWLLLPFFYAFRPSGMFTEYYHQAYVKALEDFCAHLPEQRADYRAAVRRFALDLYTRAAGPEARYFVDKTPRYHLIAREIVETFPDAKFVFLWRNPLSVIASIMDTWAEGKWNLYRYKVDLFRGLPNLLEAAEQLGPAACHLRYEDLVDAHSESGFARLFSWLGRPYDPAWLARVDTLQVPGQMGDPTGSRRYAGLSDASVERYRTTLANPLRKAWVRRYLDWLGAERLAAMGYSLAELQAALASVPNTRRFVRSDLLRMGVIGPLQPWLEPEILRSKRGRRWRDIVAHG